MLKQSLALLVISYGVLASTVPACQDSIGGTCGNSSLPREQNCCSKGYCQPWNSGYYQCLDTPARCPTQETDIDYYGEDIKTIKGLLPNQCCDECYNTAGCTAYTFVNENSDGKSACYLKKATGGRVEKKGAVSAKLAEPQAPGNCPTLDRGFDYIGNDLRTVRSVSLSQCCDQCGNTTGCTAYTYKTMDWDGQSSCFLKYSDGGRTAASGVVSGKLKDTPAPANCPKQEKDIDYYGNDLKTIKSIPVGQCCDACSVTPGCVGYTFVEKNSDGQTACYLKSGVGGRRPATGAVSGELKCPTQPFGQCGSSQTGALCCPQGQYCQPWNPSYYQCIAVPEEKKCPTVVTGIDFYGSDLEVKYGLQPGECCDACYNSTTCHVYTFINYREGSTACYLKSAITEQRANTAAISGYKNKLAIVS